MSLRLGLAGAEQQAVCGRARGRGLDGRSREYIIYDICDPLLQHVYTCIYLLGYLCLLIKVVIIEVGPYVVSSAPDQPGEACLHEPEALNGQATSYGQKFTWNPSKSNGKSLETRQKLG